MATVLCAVCDEYEALGNCHICERPICGDCTGMRDGQGGRMCKEREGCDETSCADCDHARSEHDPDCWHSECDCKVYRRG